MGQRHPQGKSIMIILLVAVLCLGLGCLLFVELYFEKREAATVYSETEETIQESVKDADSDIDSSADSAADRAAAQAGEQELEVYEQEESDLWILFDNLKFSRQKDRPRIGFYAVILISYLVCLGPVSYFGLKRLDRMEWMWFTIPMLAIGFTVWILFVNRNITMTEPTVDCLSVHSPQQNDVVYLASTSPGKSSYTLVFDSNVKEAVPLYLGGEYILSGNYLYQKEIGYDLSTIEGNLVLSLSPQETFSRDYFYLETEKQQTDSVEVALTDQDGMVEGQIKNTTGYDFSCMLVYYQGQSLFYPDVKQGETIQWEKEKWETIHDPNASHPEETQQVEDNTQSILNFAYEKYLMDSEEDQVSIIGVLAEEEQVAVNEHVSQVSRGIFYQTHSLEEE